MWSINDSLNSYTVSIFYYLDYAKQITLMMISFFQKTEFDIKQVLVISLMKSSMRNSILHSHKEQTMYFEDIMDVLLCM